MSALPERGRYDAIGEPITGMTVCWDCAAVVPHGHGATHDAFHERQELAEGMADMFLAVAVEVFHGDDRALYDRMSPKARDLLSRWATMRTEATRG